MPLTNLIDVDSFMFSYRELHLPAKMQTFSALIRMYDEISLRDLWLDNEEQRKRKDQIVNSVAMLTVSSSMMILEDFFYTCYSLNQRDPLRIPKTLAQYRRPSDVVKDLSKKNGVEFCLNLLHYAKESDLRSSDYSFLTDDEKSLILRVHDHNARALSHTLGI